MDFYKLESFCHHKFTGQMTEKTVVFFSKDQIDTVVIKTDHDLGLTTCVVYLNNGNMWESNYENFCESFKRDFPQEKTD
jgi:hypothetical protein